MPSAQCVLWKFTPCQQDLAGTETYWLSSGKPILYLYSLDNKLRALRVKEVLKCIFDCFIINEETQ